jgi:biotin transport system substrate-specific component
LTLVALFSALTVAGAYIRVPLPPVPLTLQTMMVYLAGLVLGARGGGLSQVIYLLIGLLGLPVFAGGGGPAYVLSPTFGYLAAFVPASMIVGALVHRLKGRARILSIVAGILVVYSIGVGYLYFSMNVLLDKPMTVYDAVRLGFLITLPGEILKGAVCWLSFASLERRFDLPLFGDDHD